MLADGGARPTDASAADEFYLRTGARPSVTVHSVAAGDPTLHKTSISPYALASLSLRLAPGQDPEPMAAELERLLRSACPRACRARADAVAERRACSGAA